MSGASIPWLWFGKVDYVLALRCLDLEAVPLGSLPLGQEAMAAVEVFLLKKDMGASGFVTCGVALKDGRGSSEEFSSVSG